MAVYSGGPFAKIALPLLLVSTVAGCAIGVPPQITQQTPYKAGLADIELPKVAEESGLRAQFASVLKDALAANGVSPKQGSRWVADYAIASQPADTSVVAVERATGSELPSDQSAKTHWYDKCEPQRVKGSLVVFDRQSNEVVARSEGHFIACPDDQSELGNLARLLVRAIEQ